ncbi:PAS domain S-box/diguanylate cyclase (GGDEF) domain-containing protein [Desulfosporosinus orientis DSM 765]|uniref:PAS domain S-box/diguanylate cyclase (GGDEF) domain-containing protein n=1 Tax=Desulfosporosinus orientis (strain ATCC 19365 / DSM 765 / NCIMB 8382 / VKM B-1628 / Singapore I) TaxID=768706 RepID=G7WDP1_DESOD|nr:HD domain-containing phosphohydrolase [Desulfosporosinus orientis]AET68366.1 PAS domain S-box/diguanylate cyclase (GGDEF) domain-containing protein [Desulfosporosinus orientis DSM 765]
MRILFELLYNLSILVSISIISGYISYRREKNQISDCLQGVLFGSACIIGMLHPLVVAPGLIFDGRSIMISIVGFFFGPIAGIIAGSMALILRIYQGGDGVIMGVLVILTSALWGNHFFQWNLSHQSNSYKETIKQLFSMGVFVHITMVLLMFTLPADKSLSTMKSMGLPVLLAYPLATVFIGRIITESNERTRMAEALRKSQKQLISINHELEASMEDVVAAQEELRSQFDELQKSNELLKASEYTFRKLFDDSSDAVFIIQEETITDCNQAAAELLGYDSKNNMIGKHILEISPDYQANGNKSEECLTEILASTNKHGKSKFEWWHQKKDGTLFLVEVMLTSILLHGERVLHGVLRDISERNAMEQQLEYLSYHDQLTGLYNRRFFEEELKRLDTKRNLPLSIIMADVNGLKLINDSFGHAVGDELLIKVADVIRKGCRADEIIARVGGDEFVILLPKTDGNETEQIIRRVKDYARLEKVNAVDVSVSFGWDTKHNEAEKVQEILKKAEDHMYKRKLYESPSMRGKTVTAIIDALYKKNSREERHSYKVSLLCKSMGQALGMMEGEIEELRTAGLLHDIGKIAIEDRILNKKEILTNSEWKEIKRHSEIGYRILSTVNDLSEIAEYVLYHHEKWDGSGYPKALKGYEIPIQSRIIAIADSYDAMTGERSYQRPLSEEKAIKELKKNAGSQFDPELVEVFINIIWESHDSDKD